MRILFLGILTILVTCSDLSNQLNEGASERNHKKSGRRATVEAWAKSLTPMDYNATEWARTLRKQPQNFFDEYVRRLSDVFKDMDTTLNFVLVGACDGTNDNTIRDRFLPNEHWQGLFVEPVPNNFKELGIFLSTNKVSHRSYTINAAVTNVCESENVTFKVHRAEEMEPDAAHWLRRQIGSIVAPGVAVGKDWNAVHVKCMTPAHLVAEWATVPAHVSVSKKNKQSRKK